MTVLTGPIATFNTLVGGAGYAPGSYLSVPLIYSGSPAYTGGNSAVADITVGGGGAVTAVTLHVAIPKQVVSTGKNYQAGDVLTANPNFDGVGSGAGFTINAGTLANACENCLWGKIVPATAPPDLAGLRYCGNTAFANAAPDQPQNPNRGPWAPNITVDDYVCSDGVNVNTLVSFAAGSSNLPSTAFPGTVQTIFPAAGASFTFAAPGITRCWLFGANPNGAAFILAHGLKYAIGSGAGAATVTISSSDNAAFAGTEAFAFLGMP